MQTPRCIKCNQKLLEGMYREETLKGSICGDCYDSLLRTMGWGNYAQMYLGYNREPRGDSGTSSDMDAWNDIGGAG